MCLLYIILVHRATARRTVFSRLKYSRNTLCINALPFAHYFRQRIAPFIRHRRRSQGYQSNRLQNRFDYTNVLFQLIIMSKQICRLFNSSANTIRLKPLIFVLVLVLQPKQMANEVRRYIGIHNIHHIITYTHNKRRSLIAATVWQLLCGIYKIWFNI